MPPRKNAKAKNTQAEIEAKNDPERIAARAAVRSVARVSRVKGTITLTNGIMLKIRPVPQSALRDAAASVPRPEPPMWHNPDRGEDGEDEPNPAHPDYIAAMEVYGKAVYLASGKAAMVLGTSFYSAPEGFWGPDDDEWIEEVKFVGATPVLTPRPARYLSWLEYHAFSAPVDVSIATMAPMLIESVGEEEMDRTVEAFRGRAKWRTDFESGTPSPVSDGDRLPPPDSGDSV